MLQPSLPYNQLKFSLQMFQCPPALLDRSQEEVVQSRAAEECALQAKILASPEGQTAVVPEKSVLEAMTALGTRYESEEAFAEDLAANRMDRASMARALEVELTVQATTALVAARATPASEAEVEEIYQATKQEALEKRRLRHILITINDQFPENVRPAALARINKVRAQALEANADFSALAQRYSECPSALQGGSMGPLSRGTTSDPLLKSLFALEVGEISAVVESTMGFHILLCDEVLVAPEDDEDKARAALGQTLLVKSQKKAIQTWLANLMAK